MEIDPNIIQLWWHHEEMAMHFNELLMQYRLQLFGGSGLFGAAASYFISTHIGDQKKKRFVVAVVATFLALFVLGAAALDVFYYNELLQGTVDSLLKLENEYPYLHLSTLIESRFTSRGSAVVWYVYGVAIVFALVFCIWAWWKHLNKDG